MKVIKCDLPYFEEIVLDPMGDLHIGDGCCDFKLVQERIEKIRATPNMFCILGGDLMDTAIASSIGDTYGANLQPMEQLKQCVKIFEPIKDKILCVVPGNHEGRAYKTDGIDMTEIMCAQLGIPGKYSPTTALLFVRFGERQRQHHKRRQLYTIYVTHGTGGGRKEGGKVNRLADLAAIVDADIYIHNHTHFPVAFKKAYHRVSGANSSVAKVDKLFVNTAASLDYDGYGDKAGFAPASKQNPIIHLCGTERRMKAEV